jgi:cell division protein FtsQ
MNAASSFYPQDTVAVPADVRVMNVASALALAALVGLLVVAGLNWVAGRPFFAFRNIRLEGDVTRNSLATIRANASPRLAGNYFTLDLQTARGAFEAVPWVRHAVVQRVWPNRLVVRLEEHQPVAVWKGDEGNDRLVNHHGEVFDANVGDVEDEELPEFSGSEAQASAILAMYRRLTPVFAPLDLMPMGLSLSEGGSWELSLDDGSTVVIGRGTDDEVVARCARFVGTVTQAVARQHRRWVHADLRHADGYALRWQAAANAHTGTGTNTN